MHEVAGLQHLPDYLLRFEGLDSRVVIPALQFVEDGPVQLLEDQEDSVVLSKHFQ